MPSVVVDAVQSLPDGALVFWRDGKDAGLTRVGLDGHPRWQRQLDAERIVVPDRLEIHQGHIALTSFDGASTQIEGIDLATGAGWTTSAAGPDLVRVLTPGLFRGDTQLALVVDARPVRSGRDPAQAKALPRSITSGEAGLSQALPFEPLRAVMRGNLLVMANATHRAAVAADGTAEVHEHPIDGACVSDGTLWTFRFGNAGEVFANLDQTGIRMATARDATIAWCAPHRDGHAFLVRTPVHDELWTLTGGVMQGPLVLGEAREPWAAPPSVLPRFLLVHRGRATGELALFDVHAKRLVRQWPLARGAEPVVFAGAGIWYVVRQGDRTIVSTIDGETGELVATRAIVGAKPLPWRSANGNAAGLWLSTWGPVSANAPATRLDPRTLAVQTVSEIRVVDAPPL